VADYWAAAHTIVEENNIARTPLGKQWAWRAGVAKASRVRTRYTHPAYEPKRYDDNQNEPQNAAEPANPIAIVRMVRTVAAEDKEQYDNDKNGARASTPR